MNEVAGAEEAVVQPALLEGGLEEIFALAMILDVVFHRVESGGSGRVDSKMCVMNRASSE